VSNGSKELSAIGIRERDVLILTFTVKDVRKEGPGPWSNADRGGGKGSCGCPQASRPTFIPACFADTMSHMSDA